MSSHRAEIDTSRPFRSVKEAVAVFGERILAGDAYSSPKKIINAGVIKHGTPKLSFSSPSSQFNGNEGPDEDEAVIHDTLKKLEAGLVETKRDLMMLKERESEREAALASITSELQNNKNRVSEIEAAKITGGREEEEEEEEEENVSSKRWAEERIIELEPRFEYLPTFAEVLSLGEFDDCYGGRKKKKELKKKKKPIIPLIGDMCSGRRSFREGDIYM